MGEGAVAHGSSAYAFKSPGVPKGGYRAGSWCTTRRVIVHADGDGVARRRTRKRRTRRALRKGRVQQPHQALGRCAVEHDGLALPPLPASHTVLQKALEHGGGKALKHHSHSRTICSMRVVVEPATSWSEDCPQTHQSCLRRTIIWTLC